MLPLQVDLTSEAARSLSILEKLLGGAKKGGKKGGVASGAGDTASSGAANARSLDALTASEEKRSGTRPEKGTVSAIATVLTVYLSCVVALVRVTLHVDMCIAMRSFTRSLAFSMVQPTAGLRFALTWPDCARAVISVHKLLRL
jgi:hypothetical protein